MKLTVLLTEVFERIYGGNCQNVGKKVKTFHFMTVPE